MHVPSCDPMVGFCQGSARLLGFGTGEAGKKRITQMGRADSDHTVPCCTRFSEIAVLLPTVLIRASIHFSA